MPAPGHQHRPTPATTNPFEAQPHRLSLYTAQEIAELSSKLEKQLGPEYVSNRPGAGGSKVYYLAAEKAINLANEVFGFNGWSSQIQNIQVDFVDESDSGKISLGLSLICRVTLKDGTFHEDIGYGHIENCKGKAAAFEKAKKEAASDALKRALRNFGKVLGNCLYDKDYLQRIAKVKIGPTKWDVANLHRHSDYVEIKKEAMSAKVEEKNLVVPEETQARSIEHEDEFGGDIFDDMELRDANPDEVVLDTRSESEFVSVPQERIQPSKTNMPPPANIHRSILPAQAQQLPTANGETSMNAQHSTPPSEPTVGFITSRAAGLLTQTSPPPPNIAASLPRFNPNTESPSIRRTSGVNHATSGPISRQILNGGDPTPTAANAAIIGAPDSRPVNPPHSANDSARRIGMPGGGIPSPLSNRNSYKPPGPSAVKRPMPPADGVSSLRPPLADMSNTNGSSIQIDASGKDNKRPRVADS